MAFVDQETGRVAGSRGHYLLIVKRNTPRLFGQIAGILLTGEHHAWSERGHGRITRRVLRAAPAIAWTSPVQRR